MPGDSAITTPSEPLRRMLKEQVTINERVIASLGPDEDDEFKRIRCPLCGWQPDASSRWSCEPADSPEPFFRGCGTVWNTFVTRGLCPGCSHQWRWTSCLRCHGWSLHEDWYDTEGGRPSPHH
jgi:hypothetical protein